MTPASQEQIFPVVLAFWQARALAFATELGLPDLLAEGPFMLAISRVEPSFQIIQKVLWNYPASMFAIPTISAQHCG
jgi:hypothetical protein